MKISFIFFFLILWPVSGFVAAEDRAEDYLSKLDKSHKFQHYRKQIDGIHSPANITEETLPAVRALCELDLIESRLPLLYKIKELSAGRRGPSFFHFLFEVGKFYGEDAQYQALCDTLLKDSLLDLVRSYAQDPTLEEAGKENSLALEATLDQVLAPLLELSSPQENSLIFILRNLEKFSAHEEKIVSSLPHFLQQIPFLLTYCDFLLEAPHRRANLTYLLDFLSTTDPFLKSHHSDFLSSFVSQLFKNHKSMLQESDFEKLYTTFQRNNLYGPFQQMWEFLSIEHPSLFQHQLLTFWNVPTDTVDSSLSPPHFLNAVLNKAFQTQSTSLSTLEDFLTTPLTREKRTNPTLDWQQQSLYLPLKRSAIFDDTSSFKERIESLNIFQKDEETLSIVQMVSNEEMREYASHLRACFKKTEMPNFDYYNHVRFFIEFSKRHPQIKGIPHTDLYRLYDPSAAEKSPIITIGSTHTGPFNIQIDPLNQMIFTLVRACYSTTHWYLYACDLESGYARWVYSFQDTDKGMGLTVQNYFYTIAQEKVYMVHHNLINVLDKYRGEGSRWSLSLSGQITQVYDNEEGTLFVGVKTPEDTKVLLLNSTTFQEEASISLPLSYKEKVFRGAGAYFLYPIRFSLMPLIIDGNGTTKSVETESPLSQQEHSFQHYSSNSLDHLTFTSEHLFCQKWIEKGHYQLVKYNLATGGLEEACDLPGFLDRSIQVTPDGQMLIGLNKKALLGFKTTPLELMWQRDIRAAEIDQITLSSKGTLIYGIPRVKGFLWSYDVTTGEEHQLNPCGGEGYSNGACSELIGVLPTTGGIEKVLISYKGI